MQENSCTAPLTLKSESRSNSWEITSPRDDSPHTHHPWWHCCQLVLPWTHRSLDSLGSLLTTFFGMCLFFVMFFMFGACWNVLDIFALFEWFWMFRNGVEWLQGDIYVYNTYKRIHSYIYIHCIYTIIHLFRNAPLCRQDMAVVDKLTSNKAESKCMHRRATFLGS